LKKRSALLKKKDCRRRIVGKGKTVSSRQWLQRQSQDSFVKKARTEGYRCRAAYKLLALEQRYGFLKGARVIIDLGAAPGGWSQVLAQNKSSPLKEKPLLIAVDSRPFSPIEGITFVQGMFEDEKTQRSLISLLQGRAVDVVLSDMAPNTIGRRQIDHLQSLALAEEAYTFAQQYLVSGGHFVTKIFQGGAEKSFFNDLKQNFQNVFFAKPPASRAESCECYLVAMTFRKRGAPSLALTSSLGPLVDPCDVDHA
jgi:23S rRNA (uridine2552-2'-O)-methyltransferase